MRAAILQMTASDDPGDNARRLARDLEAAADRGAQIVFTPEVTNCVSLDRARQASVLQTEADDPVVRTACEKARALGLWVALGSVAVKPGGAETRFANRSLLIDAEGAVVARYDKIHMFDVQVSPQETFRESDGFAPGDRAALAATPWGVLGLSICYDVRFAALYRLLAQAGAQVLAVPAAFSPATGPSHWQVLLQARAIETGCWVVAAAQTGRHPARAGRARTTHGHSLVVSPWGEVVLDAGRDPGLHLVDLDLGAVDDARGKVPALRHDRRFTAPQPV